MVQTALAIRLPTPRWNDIYRELSKTYRSKLNYRFAASGEIFKHFDIQVRSCRNTLDTGWDVEVEFKNQEDKFWFIMRYL